MSKSLSSPATDLDQIAATLENLPKALAALLAAIDDAALRQEPEPGEWCVLEIIGHLITGDGPAFRDRIATIVEGRSPIPGFDPIDAIGDRRFRDEPLAGLLDELATERAISSAFVRGLSVADLDRTAQFGDGRTFAAHDFVLEWPFHDHDHVQQILENLKATHLPGMTSSMRSALTGLSD